MLSWRADFGLAGYMEKETCEALAELIVSEGFRTNPDDVAVEKLSCCQVAKEFLDSEYKECPALKDGFLVRPFSIGYIKGWKRSVSLLIVLQGLRELQLGDQLEHHVRATCLV